MLNTTKPLAALFAFILIFVAVPTVLAQFDMEELRKSEEYFKFQKEQQKRIIRQQDNQLDFSHYYQWAYFKGSEAQKAFGLTEPQRKAFLEIHIDTDRDPEYAQISNDYRRAVSEIQRQYGSEMQNVSLKDQVRLIELRQKMSDYPFKKHREMEAKIFTPEQKQKFRELAIAGMGKGGNFLKDLNLDVLEALKLSDEQREKMKKIQKDLAPQYEQYLEQAADCQVRCNNKFNEIMDSKKQNPAVNQEERNAQIRKYIEESTKIHEFIVNEPEFRDAIKKSNELRTAYSTALKFQMYDVLTDEQMNRLSELINNPPDYVKLAMGSDSQTSSEPPSFLDSWKPGDPIPEEYKKHRENRRRFPKKK